LRLGVTGLARSGKTVFITALVRNLVAGGRLPFFGPSAEGRILSAHLEPQPDDEIPRFDYEAHLAALGGDPPEWPESTRRISELRVSISFLPQSRVRRALGIKRLHVDIVDYPGEWLLDLAMLGESYASWSADALRLAREPVRRALARAWLDFSSSIDPLGAEDEQKALEGANLFTQYLRAARACDPFATVGPGRFLMAGDLEGSPLLTFFPIATDPTSPPPRGSFGAMMARRYDSYVSHVVVPFFREHFARLDRQIVLVDVLGALNGGVQAVSEMERGLAAVLKAFRPGLNSWLALLTGRRIDRLLFAATKADHIHHSSHDRLEALLRLVTERASAKARATGATVHVLALSSLRATREAEARDGSGLLPCIVGVPMPGEVLAGTTFDGFKEVAVFPGDLPADPKTALQQTAQGSRIFSSFPRFRPPRLASANLAGEIRAAPHIRLDRALDYLIGDWLQ
jgi:predicted YcjX-like family ATPase